MKRKIVETKSRKEAALSDLKAIAEKMFKAQVIWETAHFDSVLRRLWEKRTGQKVEEWDTLSTGRNRFMNLVDWVKAHYTSQGVTMTVTFNKREYRLWHQEIGFIQDKGQVTTVRRMRDVMLEFGREVVLCELSDLQ